jgi:hypothetical protein
MAGGDMYQCLRFDVIKEMFPEELAFLQARRWDFIDNGHSDYFTLLNGNQLSTWHLNNIRGRMADEIKEKAKAEADAQKKVKFEPASLTSSHRNY